jgi:hypothetical protein
MALRVDLVVAVEPITQRLVAAVVRARPVKAMLAAMRSARVADLVAAVVMAAVGHIQLL